MAKQKKEQNLMFFWILMAVVIVPVAVMGAMVLFEVLGTTTGFVLGAIVGGAVGFGIFMVLGAILSGILPERVFCKYFGGVPQTGGDPHHQFEQAYTQNQILNK